MKKTPRVAMCNCFAARHVTRFYEREMADANLTSEQFSLLVLLDENQDLSMNVLAERMSMDRTTFVASRQAAATRRVGQQPASEWGVG